MAIRKLGSNQYQAKFKAEWKKTAYLLLLVACFLIGGAYGSKLYDTDILGYVVFKPYVPPMVSPVSENHVTSSERKATQEAEISRFLRKYRSPLEGMESVFWQAAHDNGLDYRLLVAVAGVESSFGKNYYRQTNNFMGWGSGTISFDSRVECIEVVAKKIATLPYYKTFRQTKTVRDFALAYNRPYYKSYERKLNYFIEEMSEVMFQ